MSVQTRHGSVAEVHIPDALRQHVRSCDPASASRTLPALLWKTAIVGSVVVTTNAIGNYALRVGLSRVGVLESWSPLTYIRVLAHPWIAAGVMFMMAWLASRLALLSTTSVSFAVPLTASSYILETALAKYWLKEHVDWHRWVGASLVALGVALLAI